MRVCSIGRFQFIPLDIINISLEFFLMLNDNKKFTASRILDLNTKIKFIDLIVLNLYVLALQEYENSQDY